MPRLPDSYLTSDAFKTKLDQADRLATSFGLPKWPARIAWVTIADGPLTARRFAQRRPRYEESRAWLAYCNLLKSGILNEEQDGYYCNDTGEWSDDNIWDWVVAFIYVAAEYPVPESFFGR